MAKIFITGSADGLGALAGKLLISQGHQVLLHARNAERAQQTQAAYPGCIGVVVGDLAELPEMRALAAQVNALGPCDAVIHNVGLGTAQARIETVAGLTRLFAVNVVAPYVLSALITRPNRLVYLSSGLHRGGNATLDDLQWKTRPWQALQAYSDTKLHDTILAMALARRWPQTLVNAVDPGWVPTRMGGAGATDDLVMGAETQAWLAVSADPAAQVTGTYFHHQRAQATHPAAGRVEVQDALLEYLELVSAVAVGPPQSAA